SLHLQHSLQKGVNGRIFDWIAHRDIDLVDRVRKAVKDRKKHLLVRQDDHRLFPVFSRGHLFQDSSNQIGLICLERGGVGMDLCFIGLDKVGYLLRKSWPKDLVLLVLSVEKSRLLPSIPQVILVDIPVNLRTKLGDKMLDQFFLCTCECIETNEYHMFLRLCNLVH